MKLTEVINATGCPPLRSASFSGRMRTHTVTLLLELALLAGFLGALILAIDILYLQRESSNASIP